MVVGLFVPVARRGRRERRRGVVGCRIRSPTCICTPSSRCSTVRRGSATWWRRPPPTASPRSASPTTATCTGSSTSTRPAKNQGVKPIIGTELYRPTSTAPSARPAGAAWTTPVATPRAGARPTTTSPLLAENNTGYKNLIQLSSRAYLEGYYMKPKVDWELLEAHHEGIIATTGCLGGQVLQALMQGDDEGGAGEGRPPPGHLRPGQPLRRDPGPRHPRAAHAPTRSCSRSPASIGAPLLATNDSHYTHQRRRRGPRRPPVRADRVAHERPRPVQVPRRRALPEDGGRDALAVPRGARGVRQHALDRRALRRRDRVRQAAAARTSRCPRASPTTASTSSTSPSRAPASAGATSCPTASSSGWPTSSRSSPTWGSARTSSSSGTSSSTPATPTSASGPGRGSRRRLRGGLLACASPTSTPSSTTCCSSAS